jgi:hypothetical protein
MRKINTCFAVIYANLLKYGLYFTMSITDREFQMKNANLTSRFRGLNQVILLLFLFASPLAGAYAACCAGHGGVASCNKATGHQMCKDGTASPTCTCAVPKTSKKATTATTTPATSTATKPKATPKTTTTTSPATTTKSTTTSKPSTSSKSTPTSTTSAKGCCSRHGGVAQCDKASGHQMCKDGTASPSCTCQ